MLRRDVMLKMYAGDGVTEAEVIKNKHDVMDTLDFKRVFRARKRNERKPPAQVVKHMLKPSAKDSRWDKIRELRIEKQKKARAAIKIRKYKRI